MKKILRILLKKVVLLHLIFFEGRHLRGFAIIVHLSCLNSLCVIICLPFRVDQGRSLGSAQLLPLRKQTILLLLGDDLFREYCVLGLVQAT